MRAIKLQLASRTLLNPGAAQWAKVPGEEIAMGGTPTHLQPSRYVRTAWAAKPVGAVRFLKVQAAHNGQDLLFRLEWRDPRQNTSYADGSVFPDAAGVLFPLDGDAPLQTMGSPSAPVNAWFWRANFPQGQAQELTAQGLGTVEPSPEGRVQAGARWQDGLWQLVLSRPLAASSGVKLEPGRSTKVAFAVWEGSSQERGGLKSFSKEWRSLDIA